MVGGYFRGNGTGLPGGGCGRVCLSLHSLTLYGTKHNNMTDSTGYGGDMDCDKKFIARWWGYVLSTFA